MKQIILLFAILAMGVASAQDKLESKQETKEFIEDLFGFKGTGSHEDGEESSFEPNGDIIWHGELVAERAFKLPPTLRALYLVANDEELNEKLHASIKEAFVEAILEEGFDDEFIAHEAAVRLKFKKFNVDISGKDFK